MEPPPQPDSGTSDSDQERLFDVYVERALAGHVEDPAAFCARHGLAASELQRWLGALNAMLAPAPAGADPHQQLPQIQGTATPGAGSAEADTGVDSVPFAYLGEYRLIRRLGEGGMGVVYLGEQTSLARHVALKVLRPELVGSPAAAIRFRREATAAARLQHENIVAILAVGEDHGVSYLVMEHVPGEGLDAIFARACAAGKPLPIPQLVRSAIEIASALEHAHRAGVIHRDVKPSNIRITADGRAKLIDFGLARASTGDALHLTGAFAGSPAYASPEQVDTAPRPIDHRTDVYSLGVTLYEGLCGRVPFAGDTVARVFHAILAHDPAPLRRLRREVPRDLEIVVATAMEKDPDRRYASAAALRSDLEAVLELRPIAARAPGPLRRMHRLVRRNRVASLALLVALLAVAAGIALTLDRARGERLRAATAAAQAHAERVDRSARAQALLADATARIDTFQDDVQAARQAQSTSLGFWRMQQWFHLTPEQLARQTASEAITDAYALRREALLGDVLRLVSQAQELDSEVDASEVLAGIHVQRCREAVALQQWRLARIHRDQALALDRGGRYAQALTRAGTLRVDVEPSGAEVHVFRHEEQQDAARGGAPRLMLLPLGDAPDPTAPDATVVEPGMPALRVARGAGDLEVGDLIVRVADHPVDAVVVARDHIAVPALARLVAIDGTPVHDLFHARSHRASPTSTFRFRTLARDVEVVGQSLDALAIEVASTRTIVERGGVEVHAWTGGSMRACVAAPGLQVRETASPCAFGSASRIAAATDIPLEFGRYLAVARHAGHAEQRASFQVTEPAPVRLRIALQALAPAVPAAPPFVHIPCEAQFDHPGFWIMEREVTSGEYLEFLNDAGTLAQVNASALPIRVPRDPTQPEATLWSRTAADRFSLPPDWEPDTPVLGVSHDDALAYVAWRSEREPLPPGHRLALPNLHEWIQAGTGGGVLLFPHGFAFRPQWVKSRFARATVAAEPVMSYALDESLYRVFDLVGSAAEWLDAPAFGADRAERAIGGGSWLDSAPDLFRLDGHRGALPATASAAYGFRLAIVPQEGRR